MAPPVPVAYPPSPGAAGGTAGAGITWFSAVASMAGVVTEGLPSAVRWNRTLQATSSMPVGTPARTCRGLHGCPSDRKSTRLNSSHVRISYAVFCLKKKKKKTQSGKTKKKKETKKKF